MTKIALIDKACNKCGAVKPLSDFARNDQCLNGRAGTCKACVAERAKKWHQDNKERRTRDGKMRARMSKVIAVAEFGNKCHRCGGVFPVSCYEFHHVDGTKEGNPSAFLKLKTERKQAELDKCVMLCSNCHKIEHFGDRMFETALEDVNAWRSQINKPAIKAEDLIKEGAIDES